MPNGSRVPMSVFALLLSGSLAAPAVASTGGSIFLIAEQVTTEAATASPDHDHDHRMDAGTIARVMQSGDDPAWAADVAAFYAARGATPLWHDEAGPTDRGRQLSAALADARAWGLDPTAYRVVPATDLSRRALLAADVRLSLAAVRYARAAQNGEVAAGALSKWLESTSKETSAGAVLAALVMSDEPAQVLTSFHPQHPDFQSLRRAYAAAIADERRRGPGDLDRIRANLERWRWLPENLGVRHVWNNIPAFDTRVMQDGRRIFRERLIVGTAATQTPVFSDEIRFIVFQPDWGVPPSLKVKDLLPRLARGDYRVLDRRDMRILGPSASSYNWREVDIRRIPIVQKPGPQNPLGQMKFMFPNRHDVYMHDTPDKALFNAKSRAISNGCIRVRHPERLAEILLAADQGLDREGVRRLLDPRAPENNRVDLTTPVPVHNVYFTAEVDEAGAVVFHDDIYGHDRRVVDALNGQPIDEIAARDPALAHERRIEKMMAATPSAEPPPTAARRTTVSAPPSVATSSPSSAGGGGYPSWARSVFHR